MRTLTAEQRDEIVRRYKAGDLLKVIAADFGTYASYVSDLALRRGCVSRYGPRRLLQLELRAEQDAELRRLARSQHVKPETLAREAIAAYLGLSQ